MTTTETSCVPTLVEVLNLGGGVQSTTLGLMSVHGELPKLDYAIFADTGWEPVAVYKHMDWLQPILEAAGITVIRVKAKGGGILADHDAFLRGDMKRVETMPFRVVGDIVDFFHPDGRPMASEEAEVPCFASFKREGDRASFFDATGAIMAYAIRRDGLVGAPILRKCTRHYKHRPIDRAMTVLKRKHKGQTFRRWMGISYDEQERMTVGFWHPLIEERTMSRLDCVAWLAARGYSAPRSACIGCPYHDNTEWRKLRDESPAEFKAAVDFDSRLRSSAVARFDGVEKPVYLHKSCKPLGEADLEEAPHGGQQSFIECSGGCFL